MSLYRVLGAAHSAKVVLVPAAGYAPERDFELLWELIDSRIKLFCVLGPHAASWEDALDWLCIEQDCFVVTTAHLTESLAEVVAFAEAFELDAPASVEILHVPYANILS